MKPAQQSKLAKTSMLALAALCVSCNRNPSPVEPASTPLNSRSEKTNDYAIYTVPTKAELQPYASFNIADIKLTHGSDSLQLTYSLPKELVGEGDRLIELTGSAKPDGSVVLTGERGTGSCKINQTYLNCDMKFVPSVANPAAANNFLLSTIKDLGEMNFRKQVLTSFSNDPVGVLIYPINDL